MLSHHGTQATPGLIDRTPDPLIGRVIADRYRIVGHLGRGGMGVVYKVEHLRIGKLMAMKLLTGELSRSREVVRRFKREALAASRLTSVNTVQVWDFGHADGLTYLVMELVVGEDLGRVLKREGPLDFRRVALIAAQVCNSMEEAHERGIVHRDLKPENILVLHPGQKQLTDVVKVLDFGLAKLHDDERPHTNEVTTTGAIVGTPYYMAPEQIRGEPVDGRADIYGLGAVMYRAVTGVPPFSGPTPMSVLTQHLTEPLVPPHLRAPERNIPIEASDIIEKCLAKDRDGRYASAAELRDALVTWLSSLGISGGFLKSGALEAMTRTDVRLSRASQDIPAATRREVNAYGRRQRRVSIIAAMVAVVLAIALVAFARLGGRPRLAPADGEEVEPNDSIAMATPLRLGAAGQGHLGKRIGPDQPDIDVFRFDVPGGDANRMIEIGLSPLPNMPMCLELIGGTETPMATFCRGRGKPIQIPALRIGSGRHWLRITQDRSALEDGAHPPVYENVSDLYSVRVALATRVPGLEIEPNETIADAQLLEVSESVTGTIGFRDDRDVFCASGTEGEVRFTVENVSPKVSAPLVLETSTGGVRRDKSELPAAEPHPVWKSAPFAPGEHRCLGLTVERDGREDVAYRVALERP